MATPVPAVVDSAPSPEALAVLGSIPEPLSSQERVPPPAPGELPAPVPGGSDTSGQAEVPIPSPTTALGQRPPSSGSGTGEAPRPADTLPPPAEPPRQATTAVGRDSCWRVQVAASTVRFNAERARGAAEAVLMVPMVVEQEGPYYKTRTRDCMDREGADRLKGRAAGAGYPGAFRFPGARR